MTATKPRWRLLTDATRRELRSGDVVCFDEWDGRRFVRRVGFVEQGAELGPFGWTVWITEIGGYHVSRVVAVRIDPEPEGAT